MTTPRKRLVFDLRAHLEQGGWAGWLLAIVLGLLLAIVLGLLLAIVLGLLLGHLLLSPLWPWARLAT